MIKPTRFIQELNIICIYNRYYPSLSYSHLYSLVYRGNSPKYLTFRARDSLSNDVVQEVLYHGNIFFMRGQPGCSVPEFCPKSTNPPRHRTTFYCLPLVHSNQEIPDLSKWHPVMQCSTNLIPRHMNPKSACDGIDT